MTAEVTRREFWAPPAAWPPAPWPAPRWPPHPSRPTSLPPASRVKLSVSVAARARARPRPPRCAFASTRPRPSILESRSSDRAGGPEDSRRSGGGVPLEPGERDDFPQLAPKLSDPAVGGIILGTPVYFGNMSSLCKAFLDRWIVFHKDGRWQQSGGRGGCGRGRNCGLELTVRSVQVSLMSQQMIVVGDAPPTAHWGGTVWAGADAVKASPGGSDVTRDEPGMATVKKFGRRVAEMVLRLG